MRTIATGTLLLLLAGCAGGVADSAPPLAGTSLPLPSPTSAPPPSRIEGSQLDWYLADAVGPDGAAIAGVYGKGWRSESAVGISGSGEPASPDSAWFTASLGKVVVATATLLLVEDGLVELDAPFGDYVSFETENPSTLRFVLSHRSRITDKLDHIDRCMTEEDREDIIAKAARDPIVAVGGDGSYSNTNYLLLGILIGEVTGMDPAAFMTERIFEPLGMESTHWPESQNGPTPFWLDGPAPECPKLTQALGTDGALVTTTADLDRFYRGLFDGSLLSDETLAEMLLFESEVFGVPYGLGIADVSEPIHPWLFYGFGGSGDGYNTRGFHDPSQGLSVIYYTQGDSGIDAETAIDAARGMLLAGSIADVIDSAEPVSILEDAIQPWAHYCSDAELRASNPVIGDACDPESLAESDPVQHTQRTALVDALWPSSVTFTDDPPGATVRIGGPVWTDEGLLVPIEQDGRGGLYLFRRTLEGWETDAFLTWEA